jgi:glycosyltransferase involved in cell wall biosynthesis
MKIILVTDAWEPQINGVVRTWQNVIKELENNFDIGSIEVIHPGWFKTMPMPSYPEIEIATNAWKISEYLDWMYSGWSNPAIHIVTEGPLGFFARRWCHKNNVPYTTSYHTKFPEYVHARTRIPTSWTYKVMHWMHDRSHAVLVPTESMKKELDAKGFKNVKAWTRGVDTSLFNPAKSMIYSDILPEAPVWLNVGRVSVEKNLEVFFELDVEGTKICVGDGPSLEKYKKKYPDVMFVGAKVGNELAAYYAIADVFIFPSKTDTFGVVMLEAMASGVPVAAYPVTGPIDLIENGVTGYLDDNLTLAANKCLSLDKQYIINEALKHKWSDVAKEFVDSLVVKK